MSGQFYVSLEIVVSVVDLLAIVSAQHGKQKTGVKPVRSDNKIAQSALTGGILNDLNYQIASHPKAIDQILTGMKVYNTRCTVTDH